MLKETISDAEDGSDITAPTDDVTSFDKAPTEPLCNTVRTAMSGRLDTVGKLLPGIHLMTFCMYLS